MFNFFKKIPSISAQDLLQIKNQVNILDVRSPQEIQKAERSLFKRYTTIPLPLLESQMKKLDKNKKYYILCHSGSRSSVAARFLIKNGYDCVVIKRGVIGLMSAIK